MASSSDTVVKASSSDNFLLILVHRTEDGRSDRIYSYDEPEYIHTRRFVNIVREIMKLKVSHGGLEGIADVICGQNPDDWYKEHSPGDLAQMFIVVLLGNFIPLFNDDFFADPNFWAGYCRRPVQEGEDFDPYDQAISLNGAVSRYISILKILCWHKLTIV